MDETAVACACISSLEQLQDTSERSRHQPLLWQRPRTRGSLHDDAWSSRCLPSPFTHTISSLKWRGGDPRVWVVPQRAEPTPLRPSASDLLHHYRGQTDPTHDGNGRSHTRPEPLCDNIYTTLHGMLQSACRIKTALTGPVRHHHSAHLRRTRQEVPDRAGPARTVVVGRVSRICSRRVLFMSCPVTTTYRSTRIPLQGRSSLASSLSLTRRPRVGRVAHARPPAPKRRRVSGRQHRRGQTHDAPASDMHWNGAHELLCPYPVGHVIAHRSALYDAGAGGHRQERAHAARFLHAMAGRAPAARLTPPYCSGRPAGGRGVGPPALMNSLRRRYVRAPAPALPRRHQPPPSATPAAQVPGRGSGGGTCRRANGRRAVSAARRGPGTGSR